MWIYRIALAGLESCRASFLLIIQFSRYLHRAGRSNGCQQKPFRCQLRRQLIYSAFGFFLGWWQKRDCQLFPPFTRGKTRVRSNKAKTRRRFHLSIDHQIKTENISDARSFSFAILSQVFKRFVSLLSREELPEEGRYNFLYCWVSYTWMGIPIPEGASPSLRFWAAGRAARL